MNREYINKLYNYRDILKQASVMVINIKKTQYNLLSIYVQDTIK